MFADAAFRDDLQLSAVNSINWARVMAQIVYYVDGRARRSRRPITVCVPTGNFGNVLAGWIARRMGAPIADFIVASNANDILTRFVNDGDMSTRDVVPTLSPSMDIQVSSNFERLLFEMNGRDGGMTTEQLHRFRATGHAGDRSRPAAPSSSRARSGPPAATTPRRSPRSAASIADDRRAHRPAHGDRHVAASRLGGATPDVPVVTLATAHPAKFPDAVERATGVRPALPAASGRPASTGRSARRRSPNDLATVREVRALGVERALTWHFCAGRADICSAVRCTEPRDWLQWARPGVPRVGI